MIDQLTRLLAPLNRRVKGMVARGILSLVDDAAGVQRVQIRIGKQVLDGVDRPQMYGFSSHPPAGGEVVVLFVGGNRGQGVIVGEGDRANRPADGEPGAVVVYDDAGHKITLRPGGIEINAGGHDLNIINCPKLLQDGDIEATGDIKAGDISLRHHKTSNVQPGSGQSGEPVA